MFRRKNAKHFSANVIPTGTPSPAHTHEVVNVTNAKRYLAKAYRGLCSIMSNSNSLAQTVAIIAVVVISVTVVYEVFTLGLIPLIGLMTGVRTGARAEPVITGAAQTMMHKSIEKMIDYFHKGDMIMHENELHRSLQRFCIPYLGFKLSTSALQELDTNAQDMVMHVANGRTYEYSRLQVTPQGQLVDTAEFAVADATSCPFIEALIEVGPTKSDTRTTVTHATTVTEADLGLTKVEITEDDIKETRQVLRTVEHFFRSGDCREVGKQLPKPAMKHLIKQTLTMVHSDMLHIGENTRYVISDATGDLYSMTANKRFKGRGHYMECPHLANVLRELHSKTNKHIDHHTVHGIVEEHIAEDFADAFEDTQTSDPREPSDLADAFETKPSSADISDAFELKPSHSDISDAFEASHNDISDAFETSHGDISDAFETNPDENEHVVIEQNQEVEAVHALKKHFFKGGVCGEVTESLSYSGKRRFMADALGLVHDGTLDIGDVHLRYIVSTDTGTVHTVHHDHQLKQGADYLECVNFGDILRELRPKIGTKMSAAEIQAVVDDELPVSGEKNHDVVIVKHGPMVSIEKFIHTGKCSGIGDALSGRSQLHFYTQTLHAATHEVGDLKDITLRFLVGRDSGELHMIHGDDELNGGEHYIECGHLRELLNHLRQNVEKKMKKNSIQNMVHQHLGTEHSKNHGVAKGMVKSVTNFIKNGECGGVWNSLSKSASQILVTDTMRLIHKGQVDLDNEELRYVIETQSGSLHVIRSEDELEDGIDYIECRAFNKVLRQFEHAKGRHISEAKIPGIVSSHFKHH